MNLINARGPDVKRLCGLSCSLGPFAQGVWLDLNLWTGSSDYQSQSVHFWFKKLRLRRTFLISCQLSKPHLKPTGRPVLTLEAKWVIARRNQSAQIEHRDQKCSFLYSNFL